MQILHFIYQFNFDRIHFRLQGEPVNLREQQDAVEFFMSILDSLDEGLKALGHPQLMASTLGGCFSDQKICKECPHRYSKEEPFSVFSVDIRNHSSLTESLEQYVKGELLEGADAYHCDKCNKKVSTALCMKVKIIELNGVITIFTGSHNQAIVCSKIATGAGNSVETFRIRLRT